MASSPDPLFRNGLEHYRKAAPDSVWDRVEAGLDRKRRKIMWFRIAAGLFLLMATSILFLQQDAADTTVASYSQESSSITLKKDTIVSVGTEESQDASIRESSVVSREKLAANDLTSSQKNSIVERSRSSRNEHGRSSRQYSVISIQSSVSREQLAADSQKSDNSLDEVKPITSVEPEEIITETTTSNEYEGAVDVTAVETKRTNITYTAEQVNIRFTKKDLPTQATPEKKNASGFQKVIDKALEITNEGAVYGDLREKKNEWLSFNNLSNKTEPNK